ncbi:hypothetical protein [Amycolatopsis sp. lyj-112]|uniref:hypothetical protein n=1 Tax=Amycolatopsis sp. lyj-112 TaxID=2789288 RepID=UPI00397D928D
MRAHILATARDLHTLNDSDAPTTDLALDEIAACSGLSRHHLRAYYTSAESIRRDLHNRDADKHANPRSSHALD